MKRNRELLAEYAFKIILLAVCTALTAWLLPGGSWIAVLGTGLLLLAVDGIRSRRQYLRIRRMAADI